MSEKFLFANTLCSTTVVLLYPDSPLSTHLYPAVLTVAVLCWLGFLLVPWLGWTEFCVRLPVLLGAVQVFFHRCLHCHWLPISERIQYCITAMVSRCVLGCAPSYLRVLCCPVSVLAARRVLRSAARGGFLVPRARLAIMQRRAFSIVGPSAWNDLPFELRSVLMAHPSKFYISQVLLFCPWLGGPLSSSLLKRRYISLQNE